MRQLIFIATLAMLLASCSSASEEEPKTEGNAVYYWRTVLQFDDAERQFMHDYNVSRIYMRYFDVVDSYPVPNATIKFNDSVPEGIEVVPVVFITNEAIRGIGNNVDEYASKVLKRVQAMSHSQGWELKEMQVDCDWTKSFKDAFYSFCEVLYDKCHEAGIELSSTIRLHQLVQEPPKVDRGVLMVYNTGSLKSITTENSIFAPEDIEPYIHDDRLANYQLPLDVAWPMYGWSVAFNMNDSFDCLLNTTDFSNVNDIDSIAPNVYKTQNTVFLEGKYIYGHIRVEQPRYNELMKVKTAVESQLSSPHYNIIYHLDSNQLKNYKDYEIKNIISRN